MRWPLLVAVQMRVVPPSRLAGVGGAAGVGAAAVVPRTSKVLEEVRHAAG